MQNNSNFFEKLGDYTIKRTIGKGTFSKVKLAINTKNREKVAIKILEKSKITEKEDIERLIREMFILKNLNNENVIKTYEIEETNNSYLIIMEYCEKGELFNYIIKNNKLTEEETSFFLYQIVNGLEYLHSKGIIHRDLKPENLLLTSDYKLKIIDFGLSNFFDGKNLLITPCGSPCYASPEMVSGKKYNGFYSDIWALGIVLYAMSCGFLPFEDKDNEVLFEKINNCDLVFPDYLSPLIKDLILKILKVKPKERIKIEDIKKHKLYLIGKKFYDFKFKNNENVNKRNISCNISYSNIPTIIDIKSKPIFTQNNITENNKKVIYHNYFNNDKILIKNKLLPNKFNDMEKKRYNNLSNDIKYLFTNQYNYYSHNISLNNSNNISKLNNMVITDYDNSDYVKKINFNNKRNIELNIFKKNLHRKDENLNILKPKFKILNNGKRNNPIRINKTFFNIIPLSFNSPTTEKITQRIINNQIHNNSISPQKKLPSIYRKDKNLNIHLSNKYPLRTDNSFQIKKMLKINSE